MTKQVGFQRLKPASVLGPRPARSLAVARSYPAESCSSTWPCLLRAGDDLHAPHCAADKEEDGTDSCVDCWPHSEGKVQCKSKKKKRKGNSFCGKQVSERTESLAVFAERSELFDRRGAFPQGTKGEGCAPEGNTSARRSPSPHTCRTKDVLSSSLCGGSALLLPWTANGKTCSDPTGAPDTNVSLVELLVSPKSTFQRVITIKKESFFIRIFSLTGLIVFLFVFDSQS